MPKEKKKFKNYSIENMKQGMSTVKCGASLSWASKEYKIPRITWGKYDVECRMVPGTTLTLDEGKLLVKWLLTIASLHFQLSCLYIDGHSSHLTMELSDFCVENGIHLLLVALYPNAAHYSQWTLQFFIPLKTGGKKGYKISRLKTREGN